MALLHCDLWRVCMSMSEAHLCLARKWPDAFMFTGVEQQQKDYFYLSS